MPIPAECYDWLDQTYQSLGNKLTTCAPVRQALAMDQAGAGLADHVEKLTAIILNGDYSLAFAQCQAVLSDPSIGARHIHHAVFLPVIRNVGQAWQDDSADFVQTSLAFALLHRLLDQIVPQPGAQHPLIRATHGDHPPVLVAVAPGDTHSFGATILGQELRLQGWSVTLRTHQENTKVLDDLASSDFAALALSVSCDDSLAGLADFVTDCRGATRAPALHIVIGGAAIQAPFDQYGFLGADKVGLAIEQVATYLRQSCHIRPSRNWN